MTKPRDAHAAIRDFALGLPDAWEDHPWGESVAKVRKKVFVFLGEEDGETVGFSVKLTTSNLLALAQTGVTPTGYGLGKAGWVSVDLGSTDLPLEMLRDWVLESYRAVAPKKLVGQLPG